MFSGKFLVLQALNCLVAFANFVILYYIVSRTIYMQYPTGNEILQYIFLGAEFTSASIISRLSFRNDMLLLVRTVIHRCCKFYYISFPFSSSSMLRFGLINFSFAAQLSRLVAWRRFLNPKYLWICIFFIFLFRIR